MNWTLYNFEDTLVDCDTGKKYQIKSSEILSTGKFPVIDQGQRFIAGYSNDETKLFKPKQGTVIFGDHTRIFKFVDFPFVIGADGTKVFYPNTDLFDPKFFFYYCLFLDIPSKGYNRHYTLLREKMIPKPSIAEQQNISHILSLIQAAIQKQKQIINITRELKNSLMKKLFTKGINNEPLNETEIGIIPESWEVVKLGDVADVLSGGTPSRTQPTYWKNGTIPWVKTGEINYSQITYTEEKITELGYNNSSARLCKKGTLLMAMYGQGVTRGRVATLGIDATINQACAAIIPKSEANIRTMFLYFLFENNYENIRSLGHGANQRNLSGALIKLIKIPVPTTISEQDEIILTMEAVAKKLNFHKRKKELLNSIFYSLLNQLMTGSIQIKD